MENKLPFIKEDFTNTLKDLKLYIHNNIYTDEQSIDILRSIIDNMFKPFNIDFIMDKSYKIINIKLKKTNIKKINIDQFIINQYDNMFIDILVQFFSNDYIYGKILECENKFKWEIVNKNREFIYLLFTIVEISDNIIKIYI